jgi:hypothetical protein
VGRPPALADRATDIVMKENGRWIVAHEQRLMV